MQVLTPAELSREFGIDQKLVRKFLRDITPEDSRPGRGSRWVVPGNKRELARLRKRFDLWSEHHKTAIEHSRDHAA